MPCSILVHAVDSASHAKGDPELVRDLPFAWGIREQLPNYIHVNIPDASAVQVHQYLTEWVIDYQFSIVSQNAAGWRFRVEVDPALINSSGVGRDQLKTEMQAWVETPYDQLGAGGAVVSFSTTAMVCDIPKTGLGDAADLAKRAELKARVSDRFRSILNISRYHFAAADVDTAVAAGGDVELTRAQAVAIIVDRLA